MASPDLVIDAPQSDAGLRFLDGGAQMGALLRSLDWTDHPLGPLQDWPAALKLSVSLCLRSSFPSAVYWGSDFRLIYNDAWIAIAHDHPSQLGRPAAEARSDVWPLLSPYFERTLATGEGLAVKAQRLPIIRDGVSMDSYWAYNIAPIHDEHGAVRGLINQGFDVTAHVMDAAALRDAKRQRDFILTLVEEQRIQNDPDDVMQLTAAALGKFLEIDRVGFFEVSGDAILNYGACWVGSKLPPLTGSLPAAMFGPQVEAIVRVGGTFVFNDLDALQSTPAAAAMAQIETVSGICVPLVRHGVWQGALYLGQATARKWSRDEIALVEEVAQLSWDAVARLRAVARLHARNADLAGEVVVRTAERDRLWDVSNDLLGIATLDGLWVAANPAWERLLGWPIEQILGRDTQWLRHPDDSGGGAAEIARNEASGTTHRLEKRLRTTDGSYRTFAWQMAQIDDRLYTTARDVSEERRHQAALLAAEAHTRTVIDAMQCVGVWTYDVARDRFDSHVGFAALYGFGPDEMAAGVSLADVASRVHTDDMPILKAAIAHALDSGDDVTHEYRVVRPDETMRWIMARNHVLHDADGKPETVVGIVVDVSHQHEA